MQRTTPAGVSGGGLPGAPAARRAIRAGMSPGGRKTGSSASTTAPNAGSAAAAAQQLRRGRRVAPLAQGLLQQPQAHHVAQVADGAVDAALVGEVGPPAGLGQHRRVELDADQGPGAAGDVGEVGRRRPARRPRRRRCRASRPRPPSVGLGEPGVRRAPGRSGRRAGAAAGTAPGAGPARRSGRPPIAGAHVEQLGGGGVGHLGADLAGEPVADQVRDQQQLTRRPASAVCRPPRRAGRAC